MDVRISHDEKAPSSAAEIMITRPLPDYDLEEVEAKVPRDVDPMLASQGFHDLLDEARGILEREFASGRLAIAQLTGAICHDQQVYRPGIWLVVRETEALAGTAMSPAAREQFEQAIQALSGILA